MLVESSLQGAKFPMEMNLHVCNWTYEKWRQNTRAHTSHLRSISTLIPSRKEVENFLPHIGMNSSKALAKIAFPERGCNASWKKNEGEAIKHVQTCGPVKKGVEATCTRWFMDRILWLKFYCELFHGLLVAARELAQCLLWNCNCVVFVEGESGKFMKKAETVMC